MTILQLIVEKVTLNSMCSIYIEFFSGYTSEGSNSDSSSLRSTPERRLRKTNLYSRPSWLHQSIVGGSLCKSTLVQDLSQLHPPEVEEKQSQVTFCDEPTLVIHHQAFKFPHR